MGTTFIHAHTHTTNANLINITSADMTVIISYCPSGLGKSAIATMQSRQLFLHQTNPHQGSPRRLHGARCPRPSPWGCMCVGLKKH